MIDPAIRGRSPRTDHQGSVLAPHQHLTQHTAASVRSTGAFPVVDRRDRHPDCAVIEQASTIGNSPLIEVPELTVGDTTVGPVWFERRPDSNFHQWMSQWMDRRIDGALGGTAYHDRELIIDYTNALATLR